MNARTLDIDGLGVISERLRAGEWPDEAARLVIADIIDDLMRQRTEQKGKVAVRRAILQRIKRIYYVDCSTTDAARKIAASWCAYIPTRIAQPPGPIEHYFERLHREGIRPLKYRAILDDLQATQR
jgi:hypothetical protein